MNARLNAAQALSGDIGAGSVVVNDYQIQADAIDGGHRLTITRGSEVQTMDVLDGKNGADGKDGAPGAVQTVNGEAPDENGNVQVSGLPDGASANQQLVTDREGVVKWEEKPFYSTEIIRVASTNSNIPVVLYKVSSEVPDVGNLTAGDTVRLWEFYSGEFMNTKVSMIENGIYIIGSLYCAYVTEDNSSIYITAYGTTFSFPERGVYFGVVENSFKIIGASLENLYAPEISWDGNAGETKAIDAKYLPDIPADKLPDIPADKLPEIPAEKLPEQYKISINPDNSCSVSFTDAYNMVNAGSASFSLVAWGGGKYMQISYISNAQNISGTIQRAIIAELIHITDSASGLSIAELVWGESSGISVTMNTISA